MLSIDEVSFAYSPAKPVLRGVSARLEAGVVTAIVGPNGAGKSTLCRVAVGVLRPGSGSVALGGEDVHALGHRERARRVAYVPQKTSIAFAYTVRQYVALGRYSSAGGGDEAAVERALSRMDLLGRAGDPLPELSAGQQQRAAVARALAQLDGAGEVKSLLADEPVSAMDPLHALQTMAVLREAAGEGAAVGVVLHDLSLALRWCERAVVLDSSGSVAAAGPVGGVLTPETLQRVFGVRFVRLEAPGGASALVASPL
jgi:iron complex transport system ATP-binding protein